MQGVVVAGGKCGGYCEMEGAAEMLGEEGRNDGARDWEGKE